MDCTKFIIHPSIGENGWILASLVKNPPLITSTWVNGCELTGNEQIRVNYCNLFFRGWIIFYMRNGFDDKCTANRTHCRVPCLLCMFALLSNRHYLELFFFTCFLSYSCNQFSNSLLTQTWIRTDDLFIVVPNLEGVLYHMALLHFHESVIIRFHISLRKGESVAVSSFVDKSHR